jgi:hypothetical protein
MRRIAATGASFALAWAGFSGLPLGSPAALAAAVLIGAAGALAPGLGLGLAFIALALATFVQVDWVFGLAIALALGTLWWLGGRRGDSGLVAGLYGPPLGMLRLGPVAPLLDGFFLEPPRAAAAAALSSALVMIGSAASGFGPPFLKVSPSLAIAPWSTIENHVTDLSALLQPAVFAMIVVWALAATATSFIARRGGRTAGIVAVVIGLLILGVGYGLWGMASGFAWPVDEVLTQLGFAAFVAMAIALAGPAPHQHDSHLEVLDEELETEP